MHERHCFEKKQVPIGFAILCKTFGLHSFHSFFCKSFNFWDHSKIVQNMRRLFFSFYFHFHSFWWNQSFFSAASQKLFFILSPSPRNFYHHHASKDSWVKPHSLFFFLHCYDCFIGWLCHSHSLSFSHQLYLAVSVWHSRLCSISSNVPSFFDFVFLPWLLSFFIPRHSLLSLSHSSIHLYHSFSATDCRGFSQYNIRYNDTTSDTTIQQFFFCIFFSICLVTIHSLAAFDQKPIDVKVELLETKISISMG